MNNLKTDLHYDETFNCVQCGYCLPACPTFHVLKKESASPRGRIALIKAAAEGKIDIEAHLAGPIDLCLGCRACEEACPTGVQYGILLEGARETIENRRKRSFWHRWLRKLIFEQLIPFPKRLKRISAFIWFYQSSGLQALVKQFGLLKRLPYQLGEFEHVIPKQPSPFQRFVPTPIQKGKQKPRVVFFTGCIMEALFTEINHKTMELLSAAGCEVVTAPNLTCCGALHAHAGDLETAKKLAQQNIERFEASGADWIVNNAGGCGAALSEYAHWFQEQPEWKERAERFSAASRDVHTLLYSLQPIPFQNAIPARVTYQDSCHLRNVQKVVSEPRELLRSIPGIDYVELPQADACCGSAGIYNLVQYETSMKVLDQKMEAVKQIRPNVLVTSNPGCLLQMRMGVQRAQLEDQIQILHSVELLYEACFGSRIEEGSQK